LAPSLPQTPIADHDDMKAALREVTRGDYVVIPFHAQIARAERERV
jgi:hypothetical protein